MAHDGAEMPTTAILPDLLSLTAAALPPVEALLEKARAGLRDAVAADGKVSGAALEARQFESHALSWLATYVESLRQLRAWAGRLDATETFAELEQLILQIGFGEYLAQIAGGIPMSQNEVVRLAALGVPRADVRRFEDETATLVEAGQGEALKAKVAKIIADQPGVITFGDSGLDETMEAMRNEMRKFCVAEVLPHAHDWHLNNEYIPLDVLAKLSELGVSALTLPEEFGGMGLGKEAMCLVSEELSRGYIGVGSLGTRSEIAGELILGAGGRRGDARRPRQHSGGAGPAGPAHARQPRAGDLRRDRARRRSGDDPRPVPPLRRREGHPLRP